jgi:hypothetical protein
MHAVPDGGRLTSAAAWEYRDLKGASVLERELPVSSLGDELLLDLLQLTDAAGVLSIYVDAGSGRTAAIDTRDRLAELERRIAANGSPLVADALTEALVRLEPTLERLLDPRSPGRGRALFMGLTGSEVLVFSSRVRSSTRCSRRSTAGGPRAGGPARL